MSHRFLLPVVVIIILLGVSLNVHAYSYDNHTGSYVYGMVGMGDVSHDKNARTNTVFGDVMEPTFGITYGYNITNWIAPEIQFAYTTATGNTPSGVAREHALTVRINGKVSFLTKSQLAKENKFKFYPYVKAGGLASALYVSASNDNDKIGAWGGGFGAGGGIEVNYKYIYAGIDISNDILFLQGQNKVISGTSTKILNGGLEYQFQALAGFGVHF